MKNFRNGITPRFRNGVTPIVRIKNREYMYIKNTIYGYSPELEGLGLEHHEEAPTYRKYSRPVDKSEIESAYRVGWTFGIYKGVRVRVFDYQKDTGKIGISVGYDDEKGEALGIEPLIDYNDKGMLYYETYVDVSEVTDIYEERRPVEELPFTCPEIVYLKKDGEWILWHEYGALLKDDEWV